jgi:tryptophanase
VDLPSPEFWQFGEPLPFKGNMDTVALERFLASTERGSAVCPADAHENTCGDQPVPMERFASLPPATAFRAISTLAASRRTPGSSSSPSAASRT